MATVSSQVELLMKSLTARHVSIEKSAARFEESDVLNDMQQQLLA
jgi:hypothetical protein